MDRSVQNLWQYMNAIPCTRTMSSGLLISSAMYTTVYSDFVVLMAGRSGTTINDA